jgi:hypothetical protein
MQEKSLSELHRENIEAHERAVKSWEEAVKATQEWADAEATYAHVAPWLIAIAGLCFIVGFVGR